GPAPALPAVASVDDVPIVVRARGTRFDSVSGGDAAPRVDQRVVGGKRRRFTLDVHLALKPGPSPLASARVPRSPTIVPAEIKAFNKLARHGPPAHIPERPDTQYALVLLRHTLTVWLKPKDKEKW